MIRKWLTLLVLSGGCAGAPAPDSSTDDTDGARVYPYLHVDVFTDEPLTGNQLAVFLMPEGLSSEEMQLITREMNFSETTFVFPPEEEGTDFRVRIFGRTREMDFAGHPTIGTAYALARKGLIPPGQEQVVLGEGIGPIRVDLEWDGDALSFAWMYQLEPTFGNTVDDVAGLARALGLDEDAIAATGLPVQEVSCGSTFLFVPIVSREAVDQVVINRDLVMSILEASAIPRRGLFIFSSEPGQPGDDDATVYSRMLGVSGFEDPATGSANGPLGAYLVHHGVVAAENASDILSRQGVHMGRSSRIYIDIGLDGDVINKVRVGGRTAFVGDATVVLNAR